MYKGSLDTGATTSGSAYAAKWLSTGPWQGLYSGDFYKSPTGQSSNGYYWSSTAYSDTSARQLYFGSSYVYPGNNTLDKYYGFAVRCLLAP
jgi:uncharacterized protein (TIGR02145 family)